MGQECGAESGPWRPRFPQGLYLPPVKLASPELRSRNSGRQEMNGDPRGGGAVGPIPGPRRARRWGGSLPSRHTDGRPKPSRGAPSRGGLTERSGGPGRGPHRAPLGFSPPRCHVPPALRLRDRPAFLAQAPVGPVTIRMARGRPALTGLGRSRASRLCADPPPGPGI